MIKRFCLIVITLIAHFGLISCAQEVTTNELADKNVNRTMETDSSIILTLNNFEYFNLERINSEMQVDSLNLWITDDWSIINGLLNKAVKNSKISSNFKKDVYQLSKSYYLVSVNHSQYAGYVIKGHYEDLLFALKSLTIYKFDFGPLIVGTEYRNCNHIDKIIETFSPKKIRENDSQTIEYYSFPNGRFMRRHTHYGEKSEKYCSADIFVSKKEFDSIKFELIDFPETTNGISKKRKTYFPFESSKEIIELIPEKNATGDLSTNLALFFEKYDEEYFIEGYFGDSGLFSIGEYYAKCDHNPLDQTKSFWLGEINDSLISKPQIEKYIKENLGFDSVQYDMRFVRKLESELDNYLYTSDMLKQIKNVLLSYSIVVLQNELQAPSEVIYSDELGIIIKTKQRDIKVQRLIKKELSDAYWSQEFHLVAIIEYLLGR